MTESVSNNASADELALVARTLQATRPVPLGCVAERVHLPADLLRLPRIVLSVGPCRSGTTVFLRVFAASGIPATGKPLKVILRWLLQGPDPGNHRGWTMPDVPALYMKESIGAYAHPECLFDPLEVLVRAAGRVAGNETAGLIPLRQRVTVLVTGRRPDHAWLSWLDKYGAVVPRPVLFRNFLSAHETVARVRARAAEWGFPTCHYVLEAHAQAGDAVSRLFHRLQMPERPVISGWRALPPFPSLESGIEIPDQPPVYDRVGRFDKIVNSDGLRYFPRSDAECDAILANERRAIQDRLEPLYEEWRRATEDDLGVRV